MRRVYLVLLAVLVSSTNANDMPLNLIRICQGDTTKLVCPEGRVFKIHTATYGRFVSGQEACPHKTAMSSQDSYNCMSDVTPYMEMQCDNKKECDVKATNRNMGGDPCKGIYKHLDIGFYCDLAPSTSPSITSTNQYGQRQFLSKEVMKCTKLYTSILDSAPHKECDALKAYKDCILRVEVQDPSSLSAADIDRVMPTLNGNLDSCYSASRQPLVMICKQPKLKGDCINITIATADLEEFDNSVKSLKVFAGNWTLYSEGNFTGTEDGVKAGFTSHWLGIYDPIKGEPISLNSNDLSSLRPVEDADVGALIYDYIVGALIYDYIDTTFMPTSDYNTDVQSTPEFYSGTSYSYSYPATTASTGYSRWVNLDDISYSRHPDMCRTTYCLLGIRVRFDQIRSITLPTPQTVEYIILNRLIDVYHIYPEQLVMAEIVTRSSEVIIELIDMKGSPRGVIDIAIEIQEDIKHEEFTFTFGDTIIIPSSDRYGVLLKRTSEQLLPKRYPIVTEPTTDPDKIEDVRTPIVTDKEVPKGTQTTLTCSLIELTVQVVVSWWDGETKLSNGNGYSINPVAFDDQASTQGSELTVDSPARDKTYTCKVHYMYNEVASAPVQLNTFTDCTALDSTSTWNWKHVVTDPRLPVEHGAAITLGCTAGHVNIRGSQASCQNGTIVLTDEPPHCLGKLSGALRTYSTGVIFITIFSVRLRLF